MSIYMPKSSVSTLKHVSRTIAVNASRNMARGMATQVQVEGSKVRALALETTRTKTHCKYPDH